MGAILILRNEIETIINNMDLVRYFRATSIEANNMLMTETTRHCFAIHTDQSQVSGNVQSPGYVYLTIPTEILFVYKNQNLDDKLEAIDLVVDKSEDLAHEFFYKLSQSSIISDVSEWSDYTIQRLEAFKRFDATLSGVLFTWDVPLKRTVCQ